MEKDTAEAGSTQHVAGEQLMQAMDIVTGQMVDLPATEVVEIRAITGARPSGSDGWLWTPALARQLGFGRDPRREYPVVEDPRLMQLVAMEPPTDGDGVWMATLLRADGIRQSLAIACVADARDPLFAHLPMLERQQLSAPFLAAQVAA